MHMPDLRSACQHPVLGLLLRWVILEQEIKPECTASCWQESTLHMDLQIHMTGCTYGLLADACDPASMSYTAVTGQTLAMELLWSGMVRTDLRYWFGGDARNGIEQMRLVTKSGRKEADRDICCLVHNETLCTTCPDASQSVKRAM
jgi:hypothetical protein